MGEISERDILKICYLYYEEGKTQDEISSLLGVSRFKIGRILKEARREGLVTIHINDPMTDLTETEIELAKRFGLKESVVVRINELPRKSALEQIGEVGAQYLNRVVKQYHVLGVAWGRTLSHLVKKINETDVEDLTVVQISGGLGSIEGTDTNMLTMMLGQRYSAKTYILQAPVIVKDRGIRKALLEERKIHETLAVAKKTDLAIFGIGLIGQKGLLWKAGILEEGDYRHLKTAGAVGAICGRFFDINGQTCWSELDDRIIGLTLEELRKVKHKVGIAMGKEKLDGILGALRGHLLDVLITDEDVARTLLAQREISSVSDDRLVQRVRG